MLFHDTILETQTISKLLELKLVFYGVPVKLV